MATLKRTSRSGDITIALHYLSKAAIDLDKVQPWFIIHKDILLVG